MTVEAVAGQGGGGDTGGSPVGAGSGPPPESHQGGKEGWGRCHLCQVTSAVWVLVSSVQPKWRDTVIHTTSVYG